MTEAEWQTCSDPDQMLVYLRGKASDRKLRLFAVACCRRIWPQLTDERSRRAVEVAERYADGQATGRELAAACRDAVKATRRRETPAAWAAYWTCKRLVADTVWNAAAAASGAGARSAAGLSRESRAGEAAWNAGSEAADNDQAELLRDLLGNPHRPVTLFPSWLSWNDGALSKIAATIYAERRYADLPLLADALEEAGCTDEAMLAHCRRPGEHVRGCFAVDLLLGYK